MTLGYSLYHDKAQTVPTHFPERILAGIAQDYPHHMPALREGLRELLPDYPWQFDWPTPKIHTIRTDATDRWRVGLDIHMVVGNQQKWRYQFAPVLPCLGVQNIFMSYDRINGLEISINGRYHYWRTSTLAINDGFTSIQEFEEYFIRECKKDKAHQCFVGKIIHWTTLKY